MDSKRIYTDYEELLKCRCCMKSDDTLENMFEVALNINEKEILIAELLNSITNLTYSLDDGLTHFICSACCQKILDFNNFKVECIENDILLRSQKDEMLAAEEIIEELAEDHVQIFDDVVDEEIVEDAKVDSESNVKSYRVVSDSSKRRHECTVCGKRFETPSKVKRHLHVHRDILKTENLLEIPKKYLNHVCGICDKKVETPSKLQRHMRIHDKNSRFDSGVNVVRPHKCAKCKLRFWNKNQLERHQIVHSKALKDSIVQHPIDHTFTCVICRERLKTADELDEHMKSHKREYPSGTQIQCRLCSNIYPSLTNIIRHSKCHPENATHKCIYCEKRMGYCDDFLNHLLRHQNFKFRREKSQKSY